MSRAVTVFCASSSVVEAKYFEAAREAGEKIAKRGWAIIYGGGNIGLMGALSRAAREHGGKVVGVIPRVLLDAGYGDREVTELIVTEGLRDRKAIMDKRGDAFLTLPGGLGTLEELLEVLTLKQLGCHDKPVVVLDLDGYYDPLWLQIQRGIDQRFIKPEFLDLWYPARHVDEALRYIEEYAPHRYGPKWYK